MTRPRRMQPQLHSTAIAVRESKDVQIQEMEAEAGRLTESYMLLAERFAELELAIEDQGWTAFGGGSDREFSRDGLTKIIRLARLAYLKNPLINHAVNVQADYIWAQGVNIVAKDPGINDVIQEFLDDKRNQKELSGNQAQTMQEIELRVSSNLFFALFTNSSNGFVRIRTIPVEEIVDIVRNPDDDLEPWFYKRVWGQPSIDYESGNIDQSESTTAYYPAVGYRPAVRRTKIGDASVMWDTPVYHVKTGGFSYMKFGVPEVYSALDWAKAVKEDLEDYATLKRALARFAWNLKVPGGKAGVAAGKQKLSTTIGSGAMGSNPESNPPPNIASSFITAAGELQPIKTAGATINPEEGRRMWLMVGAGMSLPETMLSGDATNGNYATAKSLDRPTELHMRARQTDWGDWIRDILDYVVDQSATRPNGDLTGAWVRNPDTLELEVQIAGDPDRTIDIDFPSILQRDPKEMVDAIVSAATLDGKVPSGTLDLKTMVDLLLRALGENDTDEMLDLLFPEGAEIVVPMRTQQTMDEQAQKLAAATMQDPNNPNAPPGKPGFGKPGDKGPAKPSAKPEPAAMKEARVDLVRAFARFFEVEPDGGEVE